MELFFLRRHFYFPGRGGALTKCGRSWWSTSSVRQTTASIRLVTTINMTGEKLFFSFSGDINPLLAFAPNF